MVNLGVCEQSKIETTKEKKHKPNSKREIDIVCFGRMIFDPACYISCKLYIYSKSVYRDEPAAILQ